MKQISIDIETYSDVDLSSCGVYRYAESDAFEILLFGFSIDGGEVEVIDIARGEQLPQTVVDALFSEDVTKWAFNATFERICISAYLHKCYPDQMKEQFLNPDSWKCTMIWSAYAGYPMSLKTAGEALKLSEQKMDEGKALIRYFSVPCSPTKANGGRTRNLPEHAPDMWNTFCVYNKQDVEVELSIQAALSNHPVPETVWEEYRMDQKINDRGIRVDIPLVEQAIAFDKRSRTDLTKEIHDLTGLENPNSVQQMKDWLKSRRIQVNSIDKKAVNDLIRDAEDPVVRRALIIRQQLAKSSVKKYIAMQNAVCKDGRVHGMFQFYGASRTGRWAGRYINLQNLPQNHMLDLTEAREMVRTGDYEMFCMLYDSVPAVLSELIRTAFIPADGYKFIVADFSAIEARVLSYLAGEGWRNSAFQAGMDIYCACASRMFGVPVEKHGVNSELRQKGKQAELACIAEGELVLTNHGLIPIEEVKITDLLWDGESWVNHEGVIYKGEGEVITYEGLTATRDHLVWIEGKSQPVQFGIAASSGAQLLRTGDGWRTVRVVGDHQRTVRLYDIRNAGRHHRFTVSGKLVHNCGYGGSVGAMKAMGAVEMGIPEEELQGIVKAWRSANPHIVQYWWDVDQAVRKAICQAEPSRLGRIGFRYHSGNLEIRLPSGRHLTYVHPRIGRNRFGGESVVYYGLDAQKRWSLIESYGPKFVENIVQAISRDLLAYAMRTLKDYRICAHVHDELIIECPKEVSVEEICEKMSRTPPWADGLFLKADGYECIDGFYLKS